MEQIDLVDWRRKTSELYAAIRAENDPHAAHELWVKVRDDMFAHHPQTPLDPGDRLAETGLPVAPYDPAWRFECEVLPSEPTTITVQACSDGPTDFTRFGHVEIPDVGSFDLWSLDAYGRGIFMPLRDGTSGKKSYGGGRYLLDSTKGADLGGDASHLVVDFNFAYNPSCRYSSRYQCPLAPYGNRTDVEIPVGELLPEWYGQD